MNAAEKLNAAVALLSALDAAGIDPAELAAEVRKNPNPKRYLPSRKDSSLLTARRHERHLKRDLKESEGDWIEVFDENCELYERVAVLETENRRLQEEVKEVTASRALWMKWCREDHLELRVARDQVAELKDQLVTIAATAAVMIVDQRDTMREMVEVGLAQAIDNIRLLTEVDFLNAHIDLGERIMDGLVAQEASDKAKIANLQASLEDERGYSSRVRHHMWALEDAVLAVARQMPVMARQTLAHEGGDAAKYGLPLIAEV